MKSLEYFRQAKAVLQTAGLDLDDLGDYDERTQRWLQAAIDLINPRTNKFYSSSEMEVIVAARMYFKQFRKMSGFYEGVQAYGKEQLLDEKRLKQEKKLAALGYSMREIEKIMHVSRETIRGHGYSSWGKAGELKDEI